MKEYIEGGLGLDCFLQGRGTNDGPNNGDNGDGRDDGDDGDDGDDEDGDGREGHKPTTLGLFLLLNPTWTTLDN
jgi:hypothetical protein